MHSINNNQFTTANYKKILSKEQTEGDEELSINLITSNNSDVNAFNHERLDVQA